MDIELASDMDEVRAIFREYAAATGIDLAFQNFEEELAALPGFYLAIFVANGAGCVALRHLDETTCEMKRLYVRPAYRGRDLGRALALRVIDEARARGYRTMRLDTLPSMTAAMTLYESLGFVDVAPYRYNPVEGSRFLELTL
jgi:ribosomal protein S18 acetylase RimI-like enzyme